MAKTKHETHKTPAKKYVKKLSVAVLEEKSEARPEKKSEYTQKDWQEEVAKHCPPGSPIPDWLAAKAP